LLPEAIEKMSNHLTEAASKWLQERTGANIANTRLFKIQCFLLDPNTPARTRVFCALVVRDVFNWLEQGCKTSDVTWEMAVRAFLFYPWAFYDLVPAEKVSLAVEFLVGELDEMSDEVREHLKENVSWHVLLKWLLEERGKSLFHLSARARISVSAILEWQQGKGRPTLREAKRLAKEMNLDPGWFETICTPSSISPSQTRNTNNTNSKPIHEVEDSKKGRLKNVVQIQSEFNASS
jgi:transcriptional regulator with XRE-family HTH domain